jgi:hypothetical protein
MAMGRYSRLRRAGLFELQALCHHVTDRDVLTNIEGRTYLFVRPLSFPNIFLIHSQGFHNFLYSSLDLVSTVRIRN